MFTSSITKVIFLITTSLPSSTFTVTNFTEALALNCDGGAIATTDDVLGTVINELIKKGILNGSVA